MCVCDQNHLWLKNKIFVSDQKAVIKMEKDKARMAEVFLELDDDADGL